VKHQSIALIPARGGSKRIPRKNLVTLGGIPLVAHSILSAKKSKYLKNRIFVSTEDSEIAKVAQKYGARVINRPKVLATDKVRTLSILKHTVEVLEKEKVKFDTVVLLQTTSPFRKTATIDKGIKKLWDNWNKYKLILSVKPSKFPPNWLLRIKDENLEFILPNDFSSIRSQDFEKTYEIDGVLYVYNKDHLMNSKIYPFTPNESGYIVTTKFETMDIDDQEDLTIARKLVR